MRPEIPSFLATPGSYLFCQLGTTLERDTTQKPMTQGDGGKLLEPLTKHLELRVVVFS